MEMSALIAQCIGIVVIGGLGLFASSMRDAGSLCMIASALLGMQDYGLPAVHTILRPILGGVGGVILSRAEPVSRPACVLHAAAVLCVAFSVDKDSPIRFLNEITAALAIFSAYRLSWKSAAAAEGLLLFGLLLEANDDTNSARFSHLTWWGLVTLAVFDLGGKKIAPDANGFLIVFSSVIAIGVLFMSAAGCGMLQEAADDYGALAYVTGNFAMHYYPLIRAIIACSVVQPSAPGSTRAAVIILLYAMAYTPTNIYKCETPTEAIAPVLMVSVAVTVSIAAGAFAVIRPRSC